MTTPTTTPPSPIEGEVCIELEPGLWMTTGPIPLPCGPTFDEQPQPVAPADENGCTPAAPCSTTTTTVVAVAEPPVPTVEHQLDVLGSIALLVSSFLRWI